jgi:hypothetical protein
LEPTDDENPLLIPPHRRKEFADKKRHWPVFILSTAVLDLVLLITCLVFNAQNTGSPIQLDPLNPMIGPTVGVLSFLE